MSYLIDKLKDKIQTEDQKDQQKGFSDLNYVTGQSSAMDVGEVPTPLDERIGYSSQIGANWTELQISNPSTFNLERDQIINTIDQLGMNVTLHSDMNAGYASAQKSGREGYGFDGIEKYFKQYIQELASFKREVENRGEDDQPLFQIGRINPHISTSPLPPLEERMETDVGLDPFGFVINDYDDSARKHRNARRQNMYKNPEFLRKLYYTLFLEVSNYPFQQYQTFATYSNKFDEEWRKAQHKAADQVFDEEANTIEEKLGAILTARGRDQGIGTSWRQVLADREKGLVPKYVWKVEEEELKEGKKLNAEELLGDLGNQTRLQFLDDSLFDLKRINYKNLVETDQRTPLPEEAVEAVKNKEDIEEIKGRIKEEIEDALEELWTGFNDEGERYMSQDAKWQGLQSHLEIQQIRLLEYAYQIGRNELENDVEELAAEIFSGSEKALEDYIDVGDRDDIEGPEEMHEDLIERLIQSQQFQREMWKESRIFYNILPAWMSSSDISNDNHKGWEAPRFIWEALVEKWNEKDNVDIDLTSPRNGLEGDRKFFDLLEDNMEFQMDVAAASAICYVWGHFTQTKNNFEISGVQQRSKTLVEADSQNVTWIEWMNKYGIGVNFETMHGNPNQPVRIWRSKHIAVAAHAINMTARNKLQEEGGLGGKDYIHEELDGCPAKFTIDMEHIATFGIDPWKDIEAFIEQEERFAKNRNDLEVNEDKPIAKILRQYHLMDPGVEGQRGTHHGAFDRGNELLYEWLYGLVEKGFARNENEAATVLFELAEHKGETSFMMKVTMDLIELGVEPSELDPTRVDPDSKPESEEEALIGRFFGIDRNSFNKEWAKIEEHAFDPLEDLMEAEPPGQDYTSRTMLEEGETRADQLDENRYT